MRKTYKVSDLTRKINHILAIDTVSRSEKHGLCALLSNILHETGNYNGYRYLFDYNAVSTEMQEENRYNREYIL